MEIHTRHCEALEYIATEPGPCAVLVDPMFVGMARRFTNCLLASLQIEPGDVVLLGPAHRTLCRAAARSAATHVVVEVTAVLGGATGNPHRVHADLDRLSLLADALDVVATLTAGLERSGVFVHLMPFGWQTSVCINAHEPAVKEWITETRSRGGLGFASGPAIASCDVRLS
ncbi:hypothetical protein ACWIGW_45690 [Nocardia brasiliensis]